MLHDIYRMARFSKSRRTELKQVEKEIKLEYINSQISAKKQEVMDGNQTVRWIMKNWLGVTTDDVFRGWRDCVEASKKQKRIEQRKQLRGERLRYEDHMATYEFTKLEVKNSFRFPK